MIENDIKRAGVSEEDAGYLKLRQEVYRRDRVYHTIPLLEN